MSAPILLGGLSRNEGQFSLRWAHLLLSLLDINWLANPLLCWGERNKQERAIGKKSLYGKVGEASKTKPKEPYEASKDERTKYIV